jgi:hypothetical protein
MRRSLQKFESLTKSLGKIKGAPKVVNLAEEQDTGPKGTKLPRIQPASLPFPREECAGDASNRCDEQLFNQLTLLDHLLRLPAEQLRASANHGAMVSLAEVSQPAARSPHDASTGVSLFSSATALGEHASAGTASAHAQRREASADSPSRSVKFADADAGLVKVRQIPSREEACAATDAAHASRSRPPPAKISPRTRAIKMSASAASSTAGATQPEASSASGFADHSTRDEVKISAAAVPDMKAAYGSVRFGSKARPAAQVPRAVENRLKPASVLAADNRSRA